MISKLLKRKKARQIDCAVCLENREKYQSFGVVLLLITAVGCGIPALVTIPLMVYAVIRAARRCPDCRSQRTIPQPQE